MADKKFDAAGFLTGSIPDVTAKFNDELTDAQLKELHDHEASDAGQKRDGMLKAIHDEQEARALTAKEMAAIEAAGKDGVKLFRQADIDNAAEAANKELSDRVTKLEAELAKAKKARTPAKPKAEKPRKLALTGEGDGDALRVAFTGEDDTTIADLPDLEFGEGDFETRRMDGARVLTQPITFPESARRTEVRKIWLLGANGKAVAVNELASALPVGGGTESRIPEGFLAFHGVPAKAGK